MKKILFIFLIIIPFNVYAKDIVTLSKCIDGDTAVFIKDEKETKVRFLGIDAPEYTSRIDYYGKESSSYTCEKLKNANKIELEFDPKSDMYDKYDRLLAWIYIDDNLLQEDLVKNGYAKVAYIYDDYMYINKLCESEFDAYNKKIGMWQETKRNGYCISHKNNNLINDDHLFDYIVYMLLLILFITLFIIIISRVCKYEKRIKGRKSKTINKG